MLEDFKKFALRGNVVDLAIGVVIGAAFGAIAGGLDFSNHFLPLSSKVTADTIAEAKKQGAVLAWGSFITIVINFLIIAFVLFLAIKGLSTLQKQEAAKAAEPPKPSREAELLTEIRDLLKKS